MKKHLISIALFSVILLAGCGTKTPATTCTDTGGNGCTLTGTVSDVHDVAQQVLLALKNNDMPSLASFMSLQGVRFSPYGNVNVQTNRILTSNDLTDAGVLNRGVYDGSGMPIDLTISAYFQKFVYDVDFLNAPEKYENQKFDRGNIINNAFDIYSGKQLFEYYFSGFDAQYEGMDRRSLILVFDQENNEWKLIGIIHNQRTI